MRKGRTSVKKNAASFQKAGMQNQQEQVKNPRNLMWLDMLGLSSSSELGVAHEGWLMSPVVPVSRPLFRAPGPLQYLMSDDSFGKHLPSSGYTHRLYSQARGVNSPISGPLTRTKSVSEKCPIPLPPK